METVPIWALSILIILMIFPRSNAVEDDTKKTLIEFMDKLSHGSAERPSGWKTTSDPCRDKWFGVLCDDGQNRVKKIILKDLNLTGTFDAMSFCTVRSISVLSLQYNRIIGQIPDEIENCKSLTHLYLDGNQFYGKLPESLSTLSNLKKLYIGDNNFSGELPNLPRISGLIAFSAENNQLSGLLPPFDFPNFDYFNVSNNNFSGPVPDVQGKFKAESFMGNPYLCGKPLPNACPPITTEPNARKSSAKQILIYSGYVILGLVVLLFVLYKFLFRKKPREEKKEEVKKPTVAIDKSSSTPSTITSGESKNCRSEYSLTSIESRRIPSLIVLMSSIASGLTFEELLKAPAELLGRGKHGSLYKVMLDNGVVLAVKRIKDWGISCEDFDKRMRRLDQVKHQNVLPPVAFYCSRQEKLLVYEYQQNGSLFKLLHGELVTSLLKH